MKSVLIIYVLVYVSFHPNSVSQFIDINEICETDSVRKDTYSKSEQCITAIQLIKRKGRPKICYFQGDHPIIYCQDKENLITDMSLEKLIEEQAASPTTVPTPTALLSTRVQIGERSRKACKSYEHLSKNVTFDHLGNEIIQNLCPWRLNEVLVVGSDKSSTGEFPHMTLIGYESTGNNTPIVIEFRCSGILISEKFVLTTAYCLYYRREFEPKYIRLGDLDYRNPNDDQHVQLINIERLHVHPNYIYKVAYHNIGLVKLEKSVNVNLYVKPACLCQQNRQNNVFRATHSGWGIRTPVDVTLNETLSKANVDLFSSNTCIDFYGNTSDFLPNGFDSNTLGCFGFTNIEEACRGLAGDPIQIEDSTVHCSYDVLGMVTFGRKCHHKNSPIGYIKICPYIHWIESIVWQ